MERHLDKYLAYAGELKEQQRHCATLDKFSRKVKNNTELCRLRMEARTELQTIYGAIKKHFQLSYIPVYFPARKKMNIAGLAFHRNGMPKEIRIYPISGYTTKPYYLWVPTDLSIATEEWIFETLIHESAHVLDVCRNGDTEHEEPFVEAYEEIEIYLIDCGYENLIDPALRLVGVPEDSYADGVRMGRHSITKMHMAYSFSI